jgi:hypothetical protein
VGQSFALLLREGVEESSEGRVGADVGFGHVQGESVLLEREQRCFLVDAAAHQECAEMQRASGIRAARRLAPVVAVGVEHAICVFP